MAGKSKKNLQQLFKHLYQHYGAQKWWPAESAFEVMVGAILTQNTNWQNVEKALGVLKKHQLLNPKSLFEISHEALAPLIKSAGYYNLKARRLKNYIQFFMENYQGSVELMQQAASSDLRRQLLSVKGIGPETADSILVYALNYPSFVIDAYTYRVLSRHFLIGEESSYDEMQELMMENVPNDVQHYNEFHALFVRVGKDFCGPKAKCDHCPLKGFNWE